MFENFPAMCGLVKRLISSVDGAGGERDAHRSLDAQLKRLSDCSLAHPMVRVFSDRARTVMSEVIDSADVASKGQRELASLFAAIEQQTGEPLTLEPI